MKIEPEKVQEGISQLRDELGRRLSTHFKRMDVGCENMPCPILRNKFIFGKFLKKWEKKRKKIASVGRDVAIESTFLDRFSSLTPLDARKIIARTLIDQLID